MAIIFALIGKNPFLALYTYFIEPLFDSYSLQEIVVKATPLVLIAVGLSLCYIANVWNIGAEGQFLVGAVFGTWLAIHTHGTEAGPWVMPAMLVLGAIGGALYALIRERLDRRRGHYMPATLLDSQFGALEPPADAITVDVAGSPDAIAATILGRLGMAP